MSKRLTIEREFAHRIEMDPISCPVCCGDEQTVDPEWGGEIVYTIDEGTHNERHVRRCRACAVWYAGLPKRECLYQCPDAIWVNTDGAPIDAFMLCYHPGHWRT